ncbi:DUF2076 domain-containing protein [Starkeya sp. 3C]|uniref:DUF2076 domain-containing protein n=1 Tax=Ancylobacter moscoviensis TaxID=2597768 RepID=A0ABY3DVJ6_9HYPH|nr:DUF2076 family protein [Ancylobacter moscoviensis]TSJ64353.1 DUF2076 domain-containing protein [Ancylobacter moscoviensis]
MNDQDRQAIDGLFAKLGEVERQTGPRDAEAEGFIAQRIAQQPGAPYLMAQTIVMQDYALQQAQARIQELEAQAQQAQEARPASGGGLFGSLFGSGQQPPARRSPVPSVGRPAAPYGGNPGIPADAPPAWRSGAPAGGPGQAAPGVQPGAFGRPGGFGGGGGFLAGAAQTAMGVAGGVLLGNAIAGMFGGSEAKAAEAPAEPAAAEPDTGAQDDGTQDTGAEDISAADDGGFFGGGGWFDSGEDI